ncbi:S-adenosylmethionine decarboxylase [Stereum hirsutum FP-91666 SS1]|uniref:S-adenosylmethionine decarboxylase n=1 Tax=Stereum hirsutum (strain FP-91666) TaxID=721885 RepID=UPI000444A65C|nr:S-adenosylmethionine decarboxylase [Stereum hirsutum FP-91666 SS1]EIM81105.1 S-adenosylmethionine decarboxylase [Stereum hirsutum FP-91666 SS1]
MADLLHDPTDITTVNSAINPNPDGLSPSDDGSETNSGPFEGPEKLLEIWFAPSPYDVPDAAQPDENGKFGLRKVKREVWEEMLDLVKCKVLSVVEGKEIDAYLLSESSLFISPHRLILKTCGTTLNLLGLPRILNIAATQASLPTVHRCFYSRKSYFFPERQKGPHREWKHEVEYLDAIFKARDDHCVKHTDSLHTHGDGASGRGIGGAAYTVGKVNGDHWLLYIMGPDEDGEQSQLPSPVAPPRPLGDTEAANGDAVTSNGNANTHNIHGDRLTPPNTDYTIEILMTHLSRRAASAFEFDEPSTTAGGGEESPLERAQTLSRKIGITELFPEDATTLDAYAFTPCGYSANALLRWGEDAPVPAINGDVHPPAEGGEGYYTIHVTPEEGWSYASFECNVPLAPDHSSSNAAAMSPTDEERASARGQIPDMRTLIRRVVDIFEPGKISLTLFISSGVDEEAELGHSAVERAQRAFRAALSAPPGKRAPPPPVDGETRGGRVYKRTDKINYEFGGYDLAFASFELVG